MILRSREWWEDRTLADPPERRWGGGPKRLALLEQDGAPAGYAIYRHRFGYDEGSSASKLEVVEAIGVDPAAVASVWRFLLDIDWTATITASLVPPDHPLFFLLRQPRRMKYRMGDGLWVRLVDVGAALAGADVRGGRRARARRARRAVPVERGPLARSRGERTDARRAISRSTSSTLGAAYLGGDALRRASPRAATSRSSTPGAIERADGIFRHGAAPVVPRDLLSRSRSAVASRNPHIRLLASRRMTARERAAVGLVVSAVGLGILGDLLFHGRPLGVNAGLFAVAFVLALAVILRLGRSPAAPGPAADGRAAAPLRGAARVARVAAAPVAGQPARRRGRRLARCAAPDAAAGAPGRGLRLRRGRGLGGRGGVRRRGRS